MTKDSGTALFLKLPSHTYSGKLESGEWSLQMTFWDKGKVLLKVLAQKGYYRQKSDIFFIKE
jgi:hypothetical protein